MIIILKDYNHKKVRTQQVQPPEDQVRSVQYARALFEVKINEYGGRGIPETTTILRPTITANCDLTIKVIFSNGYKSTYSSDETVCSAMVSSGMYIWWTQSGMHSHSIPGLSFVKNDV